LSFSHLQLILSHVSDVPIAIAVNHRPRRVAFLVDPNQESIHNILDAILEFNLDSWGGRHNPVVPLIGKGIPEAFYPLLDVADPDVFYSYDDLEPAALERLHERYSPVLIQRHYLRPPIDTRSYSVGLREQTSVRQYINNLRGKYPPHFRRPQPCLLDLDDAQERGLSRFFRWNIGYTHWNHSAVRDHDVRGCKPKSSSDQDLLDLVTSEQNLAWQIHVCADAPLARTTGEPWQRAVPIFYGDSPWNAIAYWNDGLASGRTSPAGGIKQLWLTPAQVQDEATYERLVLLIGRRVYGGSGQTGLKLISYDVDASELDRLGIEIATRARSNLYPRGSLKYEVGQTQVVQPQRAISFPAPARQVQYAGGTDIHLPLQVPADVSVDGDECWMVDLHIYNPGQDLWYTNAEPWWCLPRKSSVAGLFNPYKAQRVIYNHEMSFEVSAKDAILHFEIPSNPRLFQYLLSPEIRVTLAADLRSSIKRKGDFDIHLSEKGRYLAGILRLSKTLRENFYLFEHPFWRDLLGKLSRPEASQFLTDKLSADILKDLPKVTKNADIEAIRSWLVEKIVFSSRHLASAQTSMTFKEIDELRSTYLDSLSEDQRRHELTDLRSDISDLTRDEILFQGAAVRCPNCISRFWYPVADLKKSIICRGCQAAFPLPAETEWSYQLNELVRAGIRCHGVLPVMRTLVRLFDGVRDSFFFKAGIEFVTYTKEGKPKQEHELDLAWVKDGLLGIAEIKTTTKLFSRRDYDKLVLLAQGIRPDIVLIAAPEGTQVTLDKGKGTIEQEVAGTNIDVWAWGPEQFKKMPFGVI
jgi:hypothetical protein